MTDSLQSLQSLIGMTYILTAKLLCFYFGYRIVLRGETLLRDGIAGQFSFKTELKGASADLASASPGLLFVLLGVGLIGFALFVDKPTTFFVKKTTTPTTYAPPPAVTLPRD